jgi:hypothetical protein
VRARQLAQHAAPRLGDQPAAHRARLLHSGRNGRRVRRGGVCDSLRLATRCAAAGALRAAAGSASRATLLKQTRRRCRCWRRAAAAATRAANPQIWF